MRYTDWTLPRHSNHNQCNKVAPVSPDMWLSPHRTGGSAAREYSIVPTIGKDTAPQGLDNCTTLVIQAMDIGIIVPACFVIAYLLKIKHKLGYILGPVIIVKAVTLVTAVMAMAVCMKMSGVEVDMASFLIFGPICIASYIYFFLIMKRISHPLST